MTVRYQTSRADDAGLRERMRAIAHERRRFGYRRLHVLLKREGYAVNHKKLFRLYREERLTVRRRGGRKRALGTRAPMTVPLLPNDRWSLDFVSDQMTDGRRFRILTVVDDCSRECLALVADTSLSGARVARELDRLVAELAALGLPPVPSDANFVLFGEFADAAATWQRYLDDGVLIRDVGIPGFLRTTVGLASEHDALLEVSAKLAASEPAPQGVS